VLLVAAYVAGWKLKFGEGAYAKTGDASLMVGQLFFLCGIALVSQIFHLNSRPATGVLIWWIGIVAVPWIARAKGAQFVSIVAGLVWLGMEMTTPGSWIEVGHGLYDHDETIMQAVFFFVGVALWLTGIGLRNSRWDEFAGLHEKCGLLLAGGALYLLGFVRHQWKYGRHDAGTFDATAWCAVALGISLATVAALCAGRRRLAELKTLGPWIVLGVVPVLGIVAVGPLGDEGWFWSALSWIMLFALSVAVVRVGLETAREGWVNLGILFIATNIITRYFDLFGTMLDGGLFFIVTGGLVTALGIYLEKKRRALLATLRKEARS
jgi:uncharacterized membrane protein